MATKIVEKMRRVKEDLSDRVNEFLDRPRFTAADKEHFADTLENLEKHALSREEQIKRGWYDEPLDKKLARRWRKFRAGEQKDLKDLDLQDLKDLDLQDLQRLERQTRERIKKMQW